MNTINEIPSSQKIFEPDDSRTKPTSRDTGKLLRGGGVVAIIIASLVFLWEGLVNAAGAERVFSALGVTGVLAGLGLFSAYIPKEQKSARTLFALATGMLPLVFSQLGALTFALVSQPPASLPEVFTLQAVSPMMVLLLGALTATVSFPVARLTAGAFARPLAQPLTVALFVANALLLIPSRHAFLTGTIVLGGLTALVPLLTKMRREARVKTWEGQMMVGLITLPVLLIFLRGFFYPGVLDLLALLATGLGSVATYDAVLRKKGRSLAIGFPLLGLGLLHFCWEAVTRIADNTWLVLGLIGLILIAAAIVVDRPSGDNT